METIEIVKENQADSSVERIEWRRFTDKKVWGLMLGIERPWRVSGVEQEIGGRIPGRRPAGGPIYLIGTVRVRVQHSGSGKVRCPVCGARCVRHDHRERSWRHLDTMQFATLVTVSLLTVKSCTIYRTTANASRWEQR